MKHRQTLTRLCLLYLGNAEAVLGAQGQREVALLAFVESSGCNFIRNGSEHNPADARAHLQKKLDYLNDKGLVGSVGYLNRPRGNRKQLQLYGLSG